MHGTVASLSTSTSVALKARPSRWASLRPRNADWHLAAQDVVRGLAAWQVWNLLAVTDIRQRYRRSRLGQFWLTLSTGIFVGGIGFVYAFLFKQPVHEFIPMLAVNIIIWNLISGLVNDTATTFVSASVYLRQDALPKTIFVMRLIVRNLIAFAHNLVIIPIAFVIFGATTGPAIVLAIPGLMLLTVAAFLVTLLLGILCTRFRDLPSILQNLMQLAFFVTPVMWRPEQMGEAAWYIVGLNPFAIFLLLVTEPIHGRVPSLSLYLAGVVVIGLLFAITWPLFARFRARIVYWL